MESELLNFPDAMRLAQILGKYIDVESVKEQKVLDFLGDILKKISPSDYSRAMMLLTGKTLEDISQLDGDTMIHVFSIGLEKNKLLTLLHSYSTIGFGNE